MRRFIIACGFFALFPVAALAYNESVAAISFNPSRLGTYTHLKAVDTATLRGGVAVAEDQLYINSKGTVSLIDTIAAHKCNSGSNGCQTANLNQIKTIVPSATISGACANDTYACNGNTGADTSAIMQAQEAVGSGGPVTNATSYNYNESTANLALPANFDITKSTKIHMKGGTFTAAGDSRIRAFEANDSLKTLQVSANKLKTSQTVTVKNSVKLGGVTVEKPSTNGWKNYKFIERTARDQNTYKVLAVTK